MVPTQRTVNWLYTLYKKFNKKYFSEQLPQDVVIQIVPIGKQGYAIDCRWPLRRGADEAITVMHQDPSVPPVVELSEIVLGYPPYAKAVFLHELIHVFGVENHGKAFKAELDRISKLGALKELLL